MVLFILFGPQVDYCCYTDIEYILIFFLYSKMICLLPWKMHLLKNKSDRTFLFCQAIFY